MKSRALLASSRSLLLSALASAAFLAAPAAAGAATITVTGIGDTVAVDGSVTLREAITSINNGANVNADVVAVGAYGTNDTINFNITGAVVHTIQPTSALPIVTNPVTINGYSQPGSQANTLAVGSDAIHLIEIDGTNAGLITGGLLEISAGNSTVRGLVINRAQGGNSTGLRFTTNGGNTAAGNFIGIDPTGTVDRANGCLGLAVVSSSASTIGGLSPADRNVISATTGCSEGLVIVASSNVQVLNNYLGTNAAGTSGLGSAVGLVIATSGGPTTATGNIIGGNSAAARNVISGNSTGIHMFDSGTSGNFILGNFIGTNASGNGAGMGNNNGIELSSATHDNTIGGAAAGEGNTIAFNSFIGVALNGPPILAGTGNAILGNSIFSNGDLGIDLNADGVTANDACDADTGPNNLQNFPVITSVTPGATTNIQGTLNSVASTSFRIEFFSSLSCNAAPPNDFGEGMTFIGFTTVTTDPSCNASFNVNLPVDASGLVVTSTATRLQPVMGPLRARPLGAPPANTDTSEFSQCFTVAGPTPTPSNTPTSTPTRTATNTPVGVATNTPTNTPSSTSTGTPTNTPTNTPPPSFTPSPGGFTPTPPAAAVPTLTPSMLGLLGLALGAAALFLLRRR